MKNNNLTRTLRRPAVALAVHAALAALAATPALVHADDAPLGDIPVQAQVTVVGAADRSYNAKASSTATKTDTLLRDTPQAITVVTRELMNDQGMQSMADVIRYVPGVVAAQGEGNRDTAVLRGNATTADFFVDGVRDDVQYYRDLYNIESVEALKGPNAMIFGRGGSGGVINRTTKQPLWTPVRSASVTLGSWKNRRAQADIGQAIGENAAFRVNAMIEDSESYRDGVTVERRGVNPTLLLRPGASTSVLLGYEHFRDERVADRGVPSMNGKPYPADAGAFFGSAEQSPTWSRVNAATAVIQHDFAGGLRLTNRTRYADYDKFYQNVFPSSAVTVVNGVPSLKLGAYNHTTRRTNLFNQTDLNYKIATGGIKHTLAAGIEYGRQETDSFRNSGYFTGSNTVPAAAPFPTGPISYSQSATDADNFGKATSTAVYLQDQVEFSPHWQAIVGVRYDRFNMDFTNHRNGQRFDVTDTPVSPRVGLVYKPVEAVSLYASYSRAYAPRAGEQLASLTPSVASFDPEEYTNVELGAKWDILPHLSASAAAYQLDRTNVMVPDPLDVTRSVLVDGQRTRGVELGLQGNITRAWSIMGGYAWQDAEVLAPQQAVTPQVPRHAFSLWNRYDATPDLGVGLGVVYRDKIFTSTTNAVTLPSFTRVDAAVYYRLSKATRLQLNVENVFDRDYYASAHNDNNITPGSPRAVRLTLAASF